LNASTGNAVWEAKRPVGGSWTTPIVVSVDGQDQIITAADPCVIAYEASRGSELWWANCLGGDVAPSPVYANGLVFAVEPYAKLVAIRVGGQGDVTETHIAWSIEDVAPDICCPVSNAEFVFLLTTEGLLVCYKTEDGEKMWEKELEKDFLASPSIVGDKLYLLSQEGVMLIVKAGPEYEELAKCELGEECYASPAFVDRRIYIRSVHNLYCIGNAD